MALFEEKNPLVNHMILATVFDNLAVPDLKAARLVSPFWKQESLKQWRSSAPLVIKTPEGKESSSSSSSSSSSGIELRSLLQIYQETTGTAATPSSLRLVDKPFQRYHLNQWDFTKGVEDKAAFAQYFGKDIRHLVLDRCVGHWSPNEPLYNFLLRDTPNLRRLTMDNCRRYYRGWQDWDGARGPVPLENLKFLEIIWRVAESEQPRLHFRDYLETFPRLETIKLSMKGALPDSLANLTEFLTILRNIRGEDHGKLALKHLDISEIVQGPNERMPVTTPRLDKAQWELLEQCRLPLETLKVHLGGGRDVSVTRITRHFLATLKSLWVHRSYQLPPFLSMQLRNPSFENLKELRLYGAFADNFNFLQSCRNLEVLHVYLASPIRDNDRDPVSSSSTRFRDVQFFNRMDVRSTSARVDNNNLVHLEEIHGDFVVGDVDSFRRLAGWMPHVKRAKLLFSSRGMLQVVCAAWRDTLEEMQLQPGSDEASCLPLIKELGLYKE